MQNGVKSPPPVNRVDTFPASTPGAAALMRWEAKGPHAAAPWNVLQSAELLVSFVAEVHAGQWVPDADEIENTRLLLEAVNEASGALAGWLGGEQ